ncbi:tRNA lysidine(34) synthetase TilS [bacterium]|nr:tRNA lysidine(34) synthetase TilS [bacterium]
MNIDIKYKKIVLAVSGGKDSIVMLDIFAKKIDSLGLELIVVHINHNLRESSNLDAQFVKDLADSYGIKSEIHSINIDSDGNIESIARDLRYNILHQTKKRYNFEVIATAHTKSDSIENFFIRLYRGSSLDGLAGISSQYSDVIRPLINYTSQDILDYIEKNSLKFVQDESNFENKYLRNMIRNRVLPDLEIDGYSIKTHISNIMEQIELEKNYFDEIVNSFIDKNIYQYKSFSFFKKSSWNRVHKAVKLRVLSRCFYIFFQEIPTKERVYHLFELFESENGKWEYFRGKMALSDKNFNIFDFGVDKLTLKELPKVVENLSESDFWRFRETEIESTDLDIIYFSDGLKMIKYNGSQKSVKDIFIDHKTPQFLRKRWPILSKNGNIISIPWIENGFYSK